MKNELIAKLEGLVEILSSPDSEFMKEAEELLDSDVLVQFAAMINGAANSIVDAKRLVEDVEGVTETDIDELAALAQSLDESNDPILRKQASAIDELLITIGANPKAQGAFKKAQDEEIEKLRAKYNQENDLYTKAKKEHDKQNKVEEAKKAIESKVKKYRPLEAPLSTRYSPDMPGVSLVRISEGVYQCPVTKKIYDFKAGYTTAKGNKVPGSEVSNQTQEFDYTAQHMNFSTREDSLK
jgi:hypothetical protein